VSVEAVGAYKPDPRVYAHALEVLGVAAGETWFVAGHWWDVWGAKCTGLRTAWVGRDEGALLGTVPEPDVRAADLAEVAEAIAAASA
jgi:2-haloacid dehalogenase